MSDFDQDAEARVAWQVRENRIHYLIRVMNDTHGRGHILKIVGSTPSWKSGAVITKLQYGESVRQWRTEGNTLCFLGRRRQIFGNREQYRHYQYDLGSERNP